MDYYGPDRMWFRLNAGGGVGTDYDAFDSARKNVLDQLRRDGFDPDKLHIQFTG